MGDLRIGTVVALVVSLFLVLCSGVAVNYESDDLPEIDLPGIFLPNMDNMIDSNADPKPCCLPKQWQGNVISQSGWRPRRRAGEDRRGRDGGFKEQTVTLYVDENGKKMAGRTRCCNDTCGFIVLFGTNNTADYYFFKMGVQKCFHNKSSHAEFRKQCIPDNATFQGSVKIGPAGSGLGVNVWRFHGRVHHHAGAKLEILVSGRAVVTTDNCLPVIFQDHGLFRRRRGASQDSHFQMDGDDLEEDLNNDDLNRPGPHPRPGHNGGAFMGSAFYSNIETSIKDPSVFTPPSYCKSFSEAPGGNLDIGVDMEYPDILDRFVVLK